MRVYFPILKHQDFFFHLPSNSFCWPGMAPSLTSCASIHPDSDTGDIHLPVPASGPGHWVLLVTVKAPPSGSCNMCSPPALGVCSSVPPSGRPSLTTYLNQQLPQTQHFAPHFPDLIFSLAVTTNWNNVTYLFIACFPKLECKLYKIRDLHLFLFFFFISWRLITLQYCSGFCHTLIWISHGYTCIPHPDPPSHLPLHPIPLGLPSAPGLSTCLMHPTWAGELFHYR